MTLTLPPNSIIGIPYTVNSVSGLSGDLTNERGLIRVNSSNGGTALGALCAAAGSDVRCYTLNGLTLIDLQWDNVDLTGGVLTGDVRITLPNVKQSSNSLDIQLCVIPSPNTPTNTQANAIGSSTKAFWPLNEASSASNASDVSASSFNLTGTNSPGTATGKIGGARSFNGSGQYFTGSISSGLPSGNAARTIRFWIKSTYSGTYAAIFYYGDGTNTPGQAVVIYLVGGVIALDSWFNVWSASTTVNDGNWHRIVITLSGASVSKIYVDGVLDGTNGSQTFNTVLTTLYLANDRNGRTVPVTLDCFEIDDFALNANQVKWDFINQNDPASTIVAGTPVYPVFYKPGINFWPI